MFDSLECEFVKEEIIRDLSSSTVENNLVEANLVVAFPLVVFKVNCRLTFEGGSFRVCDANC